MNQWLRTVPFDLYELALFCLVVKHGSFTKAAALAGLTQSAITRQIQGIETSLGIQLMERTTRSVRATPAGEFLSREATRLLGDVEQFLAHLSQQFGNARKIVKVGVSQSIGLAYLPGFFHANLRLFPQTGYRVSSAPGQHIVSAVEGNEQDVGVVCASQHLPKTIRITHRFEDSFTLIIPASMDPEQRLLRGKQRSTWFKKQNWLLIHENSQTGRQLRAWMKRESWLVEPMMQLDSFDFIINLVSLGMGVSFVPIRALALYNQRQKVVRVTLPKRFTRELVVVVRRNRNLPPHVEQLIGNILF